MVCSNCGCELMIDHTANDKDFYVCVNKRCSNYLKARAEDGTTDSALINKTAESGE